MRSSVVEHGIADPAVTGSTPVVPLFLVGVVGNISACHADARGSIPRLGVFFQVDSSFFNKNFIFLMIFNFKKNIKNPIRKWNNLIFRNFLVGVVGNISACHADARGSIPRLGVIFFLNQY